MLAIIEFLKSRDDYPGRTFDPTDIFPALSRLLVLGCERSSEGSQALRRIVQVFPPQWAITDDGVESVDPENSFKLSTGQLRERNWLEHLASHSWVDRSSLAEALKAAEALNAAGNLRP
jgi:hypothetical protein